MRCASYRDTAFYMILSSRCFVLQCLFCFTEALEVHNFTLTQEF